ncbi:triple gene block 1 [Hydrangea chlorotic mottle virus]|uniref:Triple gene block 1 n=1 Tax=Hydrangea chlorotic mottle virus TaxID=375546 RepID=B3VKH2_9VIRU|nr:triple gene block 1 [Hydrangea chlorotic mottle virus]ACE78182.2 triple gene block 1 [Hydrangea chlorotic mottle virus]
MDVLVRYLELNKFKRLKSNLTLPVVVHSVPGAGKSSVIREIIRADPRFEACTYGKPDQPHLSGRWIKEAKGFTPKTPFLLVDEYIEAAEPIAAFAYFADPIQGGAGEILEPHFIKTESHRFGRCTAQLLRELNFEVTAEKEDVVQIKGLYEVDPKDTIIFFEKEVGNLLRAHGLVCYCINEIRGQTFDSVTFATSECKPEIDPAKAFQCLTRHRRSLLILNPDASYSAA